MSLSAFLDKAAYNFNKTDLTEDRIENAIEVAREAFSFYREYPDLFLDFLLESGGNPENFNLFFYQRLFLRAIMRHRYTFATFPRAYSKSFLSILGLMIKCVLYPGSKLFITTGGKQQAAGIAKEKVNEICSLVPGLAYEIDWSRGASSESRDSVRYIFKNGSILDIVAAKDSSRGGRRHGGLLEECISIDENILNDVIIPMMNVSRRVKDGTFVDSEVLNKSQTYVTTAGWKNSFAYTKLVQLLIMQIVNPNESFIFGGSWKVPVMEKLLSADFVTELKLDGTFNESSFNREYGSIWSGDSDKSFFSADAIDKCRTIKMPITELSLVKNKQDRSFFVFGIDVGRKGCTTEVMVFKVIPSPNDVLIKSLVNSYSWSEAHFEDQAINIKQLYYKYKPKRIAIDGNGLGIGLIDYMVKSQIDSKTGDLLPDFGVFNDKEKFYDQYQTDLTEHDILYIIKASRDDNSEAYAYALQQIQSGRVKMLINEQIAKTDLLGSKVGQKMTPEQRAEKLKPYTLTSVLEEQMLNLTETDDKGDIVLHSVNRGVPKDKFSAFIYGLLYVKRFEDIKKRKRKRDPNDLAFFN